MRIPGAEHLVPPHRLVRDVWLKDGKAQVLAEPKILTLDNKEAKIEITEHIALAKKTTYREGGQEQTVEPIFGDIGVTLSVTPNVNTDEYVTLKVEPVVASAQKSSFFPDEAVDTRKRTAKTTVMARDGETIVIGGLERKDVNETHFKVPLLGDIPLLGRLFKKSVGVPPMKYLMSLPALAVTAALVIGARVAILEARGNGT